MQWILACFSSNKYSRMLIKIKEELWWKVSKPVVEQYYQLIGEMYQKKITKEEIDLLLQKVNNGEKDKYDKNDSSLNNLKKNILN